jgi:hypothetical protein
MPTSAATKRKSLVKEVVLGFESEAAGVSAADQ